MRNKVFNVQLSAFSLKGVQTFLRGLWWRYRWRRHLRGPICGCTRCGRGFDNTADALAVQREDESMKKPTRPIEHVREKNGRRLTADGRRWTRMKQTDVRRLQASARALANKHIRETP